MTTATLSATSTPAEARAPSRVVDRARTAVVCLCLVAAVFSQQPGLTVGDTKLDLVVDPARFLARSLHLWDPTAALGMVQDQSYGYLFPMGPFFLLGHAIGLPAWVIQRLWQSGLLIAAFLGMRALAARMGIGTSSTRLIGGVAYALSPLIISKLGPISSEALAECVAPWVLLPLVGTAAAARPRRAAALSAVALVFAGGINAAATLAILPLPALWLITRPAGRARRRLIGWWVLSIVLASLWWALPLAEFGRYSPPFIDWIENAATTVSSTNLLSVLSGTEDWVGHLTSFEGPLWRAAWDLETSGIAVLDAAVLVGLGLLGMLRRDLPERRFLVGSVLLGMVVISAGHGGSVGTAFSGNERHILDGTAAAFRNLHKFDLLLRVPLVLAATHLSSVVVSRLRQPPRDTPDRPLTVRPVALLACIALIGIGLPLWTQDLEPAGAFTGVPTWWTQTASYLAQHDDGTHALLLPAATHGDYAWGEPEDEPLQALAQTPWVSRDAVTLGGAGERQLLDGLDAQLQVGRGGPALTAYLARAGIGWIVLRSDLDPVLAQSTSPVVVRAALQSSPGITETAAFGGTLDPLTGPTIQIYHVTGASAALSTAPVAGTVRLSGDAGDLYQALASGLVTNRDPVVAAAAPVLPGEQPASQTRVVTDGNRHTETNFSAVVDPQSATLLPGQPWSVSRRVHQIGLEDAPQNQTTATVFAVRSVTASSSASDANAFWVRGQQYGPVGAFDGNPATTWMSGQPTAVGQWVQETLVRPVTGTTVTLSAPDVSAPHSDVTAARITTNMGQETVFVSAQPQTFELPAGATTTIRVTATAVAGGGSGTTATLEVSAAGAPFASEGLTVPKDGSSLTGGRPAQSAQAFSFAGRPQSQGCVWLSTPSRSICEKSLVQSSEDAQGLDRSFVLDGTGSYAVEARGRAQGGPALNAVLPQPRHLVVTVSSQFVSDPADGEEALVDRDRATSWIAGASDRSPTVDVFSDHPRTVTAVYLRRSPSSGVAPPATVRIQIPGHSEVVPVPATGPVDLSRALTANRFAISFPTTQLRVDAATGSAAPVGLAGLRLVFANNSWSGTVAPTAPVHEACGAGPELSVGGIATPTYVRGSLVQVMHDNDLAIRPCLGAPHLQVVLGAGPQHIALAASTTMTPDVLTLRPAQAPATVQPASGRALRATAVHADDATVTVGAGAANWLLLSQNANAGWQATMGSVHLHSTVLDGWRQAFLVPAGSGGTISIRFAPDRGFRAGLLVGAIAVVLLLALALSRCRPVEVAAVEAVTTRRRRAGRTVLIGLALLAVPAAAGPAGAVVLGLVVVIRLATEKWWPNHVTSTSAILIGGGVAVAAAVGAVHPFNSGSSWGADSSAAQLGCALALAALAVSLVPTRRSEKSAAVRSAA